MKDVNSMVAQSDSKDNASSLDKLFCRSQKIRNSEQYVNLLDFVNKFRKYSPFNNFLIYLQNPNVTYYATAKHWHHEFGRIAKENARPMLILAPMTPVLLVYDLDDTEGRKLPDLLNEPFKTNGNVNDIVYQNILKNCKAKDIDVKFVPLATLHGGDITMYLRKENPVIRINSDFSQTQSFATLVHELAHLFLGHLGEKPKHWINRKNLDKNTKELEAESVSYLVCSRMGIETKSGEYISLYLKKDFNIKTLSLELVMKVAGKIENLGKIKTKYI